MDTGKEMFRPTALLPLLIAVLLAACTAPDRAQVLADIHASRLEKGAAALAACQQVLCARLQLHGASLPDYRVLSGLPHVTALELRYNSFSDIDDLVGMQQLKELRIVATGIRDISGVERLQNLTVLQAQSGLLADIRPTVVGMPRLEGVGLNLPRDGDIRFVRRLPKLRSLRFSGEAIADMSPFAGHRRLEQMTLSVKLPQDTSALLRMPRLRSVSVYDYELREDRGGVFSTLMARGVEVKPIASVIY